MNIWKHGSKYVSLLVMQPLTLSLWKSFLKAILILPNGYEACSNQVSPEDDAKILEEERNMNSIKEGIKEEHKNEGTD